MIQLTSREQETDPGFDPQVNDGEQSFLHVFYTEGGKTLHALPPSFNVLAHDATVRSTQHKYQQTFRQDANIRIMHFTRTKPWRLHTWADITSNTSARDFVRKHGPLVVQCLGGWISAALETLRKLPVAVRLRTLCPSTSATGERERVSQSRFMQKLAPGIQTILLRFSQVSRVIPSLSMAAVPANCLPTAATATEYGGYSTLPPSLTAVDTRRHDQTLHRTRRNTGKMSDTQLKAHIQELSKKSSPTGGNMLPGEYFRFMSYVRDRAPQRLLVWGLGFDSTLIAKLNSGGSTLFLEFDVSWVGKSDAASLNYGGYDAGQFNTTAGNIDAFLASPHRADRIRQLDGQPCFDTILVGSPNGQSPTAPGRAVPMYTAKVDVEACAARGGYTPGSPPPTVWVHDCNRKAEDVLSMRLFGKEALVSEHGQKKLRHFALRPKAALAAD